MNSKGHLICSVIKSILRMLGCFLIILQPILDTLRYLGVLFLLAELLGILEEFLDMRE